MITWIDWGIWLVYFAVIYTVLWFYRQTKKNDDTYNWFLKGFLIKVVGGVAFALVSIYYYGGDTLLYYRGSSILAETFFTNPSLFFELLFTPNNLSSEFSEIAHQINYSRTAEEWFMVRLLSFVNIISFNSYLVMTLLMSLIAFWGGWKLFRVFTDILPKSKTASFMIVFLMPSVLFWGTGILKDTLTLALFNYVIFITYLNINSTNYNFIKLLNIIISFLIIYKLKPYIVLAFTPSLFYIHYLYYKNKISNKIIRFFSVPIILTVFVILGFYGVKELSQETVYSASKIEKHIKGFHSWHTTTGGSSYNLGEVEFTPFGIIKKIPASLNVTFFRPYLWEARNLTSLIGAVESSLILLFFILIIFKIKFKIYNILRTNFFLLGLTFFILLFGFAVGFTSYNFGALSRYKMPLQALFVFEILYLYKYQSKRESL